MTGRRVAKRALFLSIAFSAVLPVNAASQASGAPSSIRLVARFGLAEHDKGGSAYLGELVLRTRDPIVLGVGAGFIDTRKHDVQLVLRTTELEGQQVTISGGAAHFHSYRFRSLAGYAFELEGPVWIETTLEGGFARESGEEEAWQPWAVVAFALRSDSGFGVQGGIGRHRVTTRYRAGSGALVHEVDSWGTFSELLFSIPLI